jgi:hypothetical protein
MESEINEMRIEKIKMKIIKKHGVVTLRLRLEKMIWGGAEEKSLEMISVVVGVVWVLVCAKI